MVGTAGGTKYGYAKDGKPFLTKEPKLLLNDNNAGKPEGIHLMIGRRPYAAFGNSTGDRQMLEYTKAGDGARLAMLVLHDDATREYAYGPAQGLPDTKVGTFTQALYDEAKQAGLGGHQHEERLEAHLRLRVGATSPVGVGSSGEADRAARSGDEPGGNTMRSTLTKVLACVCAAALWAPALAQAAEQETEHPRHLGRRHRLVQRQRLQPGRDGLPHAQHRPHRQGRRHVHRLVRPAELHRRTRRVPHRAVADPTGLTKVGLPGADVGLRPEDPTIAELLKPLGYATGQFGKNHLGDRDEFLPTAHGFDEFFGNLYHLNAEEEPENVDYPKDPEFKKKFGPRGVIHSFAGGQDRGYRPAHEEAHGDGRRGDHRGGRSRSWSSSTRPASRSSSGGTPRACISGRT